MRYRALGKTKLKLSVLGFGGAVLGGKFGPVDSAQNAATVRAALAGGINFFDVAPFYGQTVAETELGNALAGVPRDKYVLATKVGRYGDDDFDFSTGRVTASIDESLTRLKTDYLDIIQCHDIEFGDLDQVLNETVPALHKLKKTGKVRFVGITGYPLKVFWYVTQRIDVDAILSYGHYSLNDTTLTESLGYLREKKIGILNAAPFSMGLLTDGPVPAWHPAPEALRAACRGAAAQCRKRGYALSDLALKFSVDRSEISSTLVGMCSPAEVERNLAAIEKSPPPGLLVEVEKILAPVKDLAWISGRPENN
jgi:L-galactose dehydrogenase